MPVTQFKICILIQDSISYGIALIVFSKYVVTLLRKLSFKNAQITGQYHCKAALKNISKVMAAG